MDPVYLRMFQKFNLCVLFSHTCKEPSLYICKVKPKALQRVGSGRTVPEVGLGL